MPYSITVILSDESNKVSSMAKAPGVPVLKVVSLAYDSEHEGESQISTCH